MDKQYFFREFLIIYIFVGLCIPLFAEAPELQNVMPTSWKKITRLSSTEEAKYLSDNTAIIAQIKNYYKEQYRGRDIDWEENPLPNNFFIYREIAGTYTFYRIVCTTDSEPNFMSTNIRFIQFMVYNKRIIFGGEYNSNTRTQRDDKGNFISIDIISGKENVKGIMLTRLEVRRNNNNWYSESYTKKQLKGNVYAYYYSIDDIITPKGFTFGTQGIPGSTNPILISASDCLVDPKSPLKYSLQNVFDGDPATSYVENTEDDLITMNFYLGKGIQKIAIINGYAQNNDLYEKNNRVKTIRIEDNQWNSSHTDTEIVFIGEKTLNDNTRTYQFFDIDSMFWIKILSFYKGTVYNDTCIAELNIKTDEGWFFVDIDE